MFEVVECELVKIELDVRYTIYGMWDEKCVGFPFDLVFVCDILKYENNCEKLDVFSIHKEKIKLSSQSQIHFYIRQNFRVNKQSKAFVGTITNIHTLSLGLE